MLDVVRDSGAIVSGIFDNMDKLGKHQIVYGAGRYVSMLEVAKAFSKATGKKWRYRYAGTTNPGKDEGSQMIHWIGHYGYYNGADISATQAIAPNLTVRSEMHSTLT